MPFGPKNAPVFYTSMMWFLRDEWILFFNETRHIISLSNSPAKVICNDSIIIDDALLFSNHTPTLLYYFSRVARVFTKYRLSFKLSKCDFFKDRVEYVGHDLTANGNCPARSKFSLIQDWSLPPHDIYLLSFIVLCCFYNKYCPWFETNVKPLRKLQRVYHRNDIPIIGWTSPLINLFCDCKTHSVPSPLLFCLESSRPTFLTTDWSAGGMDYILIHPDDSSDSIAVITYIADTGECLFGLSLDRPRLRPVLCGSRSNLFYESDYHSFVGEVACGRWRIAVCRKYLWGSQFYWLCNWNAVKEVLEYQGSIHQLKRWSREFLAYECVCLYHPNTTMKDVDGICRHIDPLIHRYLIEAAAVLSTDIRLQPFMYKRDVFSSFPNPRHVSVANTSSAHNTVSTISTPSALYHYPVRFSTELPSSPPTLQDSPLPIISVPSDEITWLSFDSVLYSFGSKLQSWPGRVVKHYMLET